MAALIESTDSIMYVSNTSNGRFVPWHKLGIPLDNAPNSKDALIAAGLDWKVNQQDVFVNENIAEGFKANVRDRDGMILGIVSDRYKVVDNEDAFDFVDNLVDGKDTTYETAGSLRNGKTVWMLAKLPTEKILGDDIEQFLCFTNTHDGTGSVKVFFTPVRVVCANTLSYALESTPRSWYTIHAGDIRGKLFQAQDTLFRAAQAMTSMKKDADLLASKKFDNLQIASMLNQLFPEVTPNMSDRQKESIMTMKKKFINCYNADDLANFKGTGW